MLPDGSVLVADTLNHRIRKITPQGLISTVAGTGRSGYSGDGGPAIDARLKEPFSVAARPDGGFYVEELLRIRSVSSSGTITTISGTGREGTARDGQLATRAPSIGSPESAADGSLIAADFYYGIRRVNQNGRIETIVRGRPFKVASGADGSLAVLERQGVVRRLSATGASRRIRLEPPGLYADVDITGSGELLVSETLNSCVIRQIDLAFRIRLVAGHEGKRGGCIPREMSRMTQSGMPSTSLGNQRFREAGLEFGMSHHAGPESSLSFSAAGGASTGPENQRPPVSVDLP